MKSMENLVEKLMNPDSEARPVPFWSWNDRLEPEELRRQIREMEKAGLGGFFMHARGGLETEYLSNEWMACIEACIDEGKKTGMHAWSYDENGWPSGFAGGLVPSLGEEYHVRWLEIEVLKSDKNPLGQEKLLGRYRTESGEEILIYEKSSPFYVDILNKKVIRAFLELTHENYYRRFEGEFGTGMKGFFTDEPQFKKRKIPWSPVLPEAFAKRYGYDLTEVLPALFLPWDGYEKIRYDFWSLVSELYTESFAKQIYQWCDSHNCKLTGHTIQEGSLYNQMTCSAGVAPFYEFMHIPGIDWLGRYISSPVIPKLAGSVANQMGKEAVLTETYGLSGWNVSFEEMKWIAQWQMVNGVTLICQHLESYTLRGLRKRDYPPSLFYQQPWWEVYRYFNDYISRLGMLLSMGREIAPILLIHPMKSAWIAYDGTNNAALRQLDEDFEWAAAVLSGLHAAHHYGDETLISRHGYTEEGLFCIGRCRYTAVILPSVVTLDRKTVELLEAFMDRGGLVISAGSLPSRCGGEEGALTDSFMRRIRKTGKDRHKLKSLLEISGILPLSIRQGQRDIEDVHCQQRDLGELLVYYMVNHSKDINYQAQVRIPAAGNLVKYRPENGEAEKVSCNRAGGETLANLEFHPMEAHVLILEKTDEVEPELCKKEDSTAAAFYLCPRENWTVERSDLNSLTLDYCCCQVDEEEWKGPLPVFKVMEELLHMKRPCPVALSYSFEMAVEPGRLEDLFLAIETPEHFKITINGCSVAYDSGKGWWKDRSFKRLDIKDYAKKGVNEVVLKGEFYQSRKVYEVLFGKDILETERNKLTYDMELESIYVVGDFGVFSKAGYEQRERRAVVTQGPFVIKERPSRVKSGDLTSQGFCFFAGNVLLKQEFTLAENPGEKDKEIPGGATGEPSREQREDYWGERPLERILLDVGRPDAAVWKLFINGREAKTAAWAPYTVDITDYAVPGNNTLELLLYGSNRNLLGPHHHVLGEVYHVGTSSFTDKAGWADVGLDEAWAQEGTDAIWSEGYCFVKYGAAQS